MSLVPILPLDDYRSEWRALSAVRLGYGSDGVRCRWAYNHDRRDAWSNGSYGARFRPRAESQWSYAIHFSDDSWGVCRVSDINAALAAAGARVDPEVE